MIYCKASFFSSLLILLSYSHAGIIGKTTLYVSQKGDSIKSIGEHKKIGLDALYKANRAFDPYLPLKKGTLIVLPTASLLPFVKQPWPILLINLPEKRLYWLTKPIQSFVASVGQPGWSTPTGIFHIIEKKPQPVWQVPKLVQKEQAELGQPIPALVRPGKDNPLGSHLLRLSTPNYLIHGTNQPDTIGQEQTAGCISLYNSDIEQLYSKIHINDSVMIINQPIKLGIHKDHWYLEVHPDYLVEPHDRNIHEPSPHEPTQKRYQAILTYLSMMHANHIQKNKIKNLIDKKDGLPHIIANQEKKS